MTMNQPTLFVRRVRGTSPSQEDGFVSFTVLGQYVVYVVVDGDSGDAATRYIVENVKDTITTGVSMVNRSRGLMSMSGSLQCGFELLNEAYITKGLHANVGGTANLHANVGSTASLVVAVYKVGSRQLWVASAGTCRAYLEDEGCLVPLSEDNKCRIGTLMATPNVMCCTVTDNSSSLTLVTGGITSSCTTKQIQDSTQSTADPAMELVARALFQESKENCTAMVVKF